jgi:tRNA(Ile)-lysidine synthase
VLHPFVRKVGRRLRTLGVGREGMVIAVSGGPDSVALLCAVAALKRTPSLVIAHLNHQLRGAESDEDEVFVRQLHARMTEQGLITTPFACERMGMLEMAKRSKENLEAVARRERYRWLARIAQASKMRWIATGHTADDQAETVLHRLLRGAGLKGLRGIAERRELAADVALVRPLLGLRRAAGLAYLEEIGQQYRIDSSNRDVRFTRNRIRQELLPQLSKQFNPNIVPLLCDLARQAHDAHRLEVGHAAELLVACECPHAGAELIFDRAVLASAPRSVVRACFRLLWEREGWAQGRLDFAAWDGLAGLVFGENGGADLPGGIRASASQRVVRIGKHS